MNAEKRNWMAAFLAGFLATALGILLTFGIDSLVSSSKKAKTAHLLAQQIVGNMDRTYHELHEYQDLYDAIDQGRPTGRSAETHRQVRLLQVICLI